MSEPENTSGGAADRVSPIVVVESASSKHTMPFRPVDRQDGEAPDLHQKRAPAVPSVAENWRDSAENPEIKELKESLNVKSSEQHKHVAKKLSSNISSKKRGSPVAIPLMPVQVQSKTGEIITAAPSAQPIPELSTPVLGKGKKKEAIEKKDDEDSITSEIAEERTPEQAAAKTTPEWVNDRQDVPNKEPDDTVPLQRKTGNEVLNASLITNEEKSVEPATNSELFKKKEITWSDDTYQNKVHLQDLGVRSAPWMLERKASVGPCYTRTLPVTERSGITICLPKKSKRNMNFTPTDSFYIPVKSGINITVSKRCLDNNKTKLFGPVEKRSTAEPVLKMQTDVAIKDVWKTREQGPWCTAWRLQSQGL
ncbi:uncharacterized protein LOC142977665 isoform X2 [Anticarsia gemmatalis]|uniref:uncharacterized protein LOC142977665 isoform X2 n=1 Tax=Anticarsia gemmatalis TaxID=129554 RepID=UPI003F776F6B